MVHEWKKILLEEDGILRRSYEDQDTTGSPVKMEATRLQGASQ